MATKNYEELASATSLGDNDLLAIYPAGGPLKKFTFSTFKSLVVTALGSSYAIVANNLSDLANAATARTNLGLGSIATLAASAVYQVANNLSEVANAATARTNLGAAAADAPTITGGMTFSGTTKQSVLAVAALDLDWSDQEIQTKSISVDSTFTFSNFTASKAQALILFLTVSSSAEPTWPATVKWAYGETPSLGDGEHVVGFLTKDGGTTVHGFVGGAAFAVPA